MADQWPAPTYIDGDNWDRAQPCSLPVLSSPIPGINVECVLTQQFMVLRKYFKPGALNDPHPSAGMSPDFASIGFILCAEGPRQDVGGGVVKWERTYARAPGIFSQWESYSYPFIGFAGTVDSGRLGSATTVLGRPREARIVNSRVVHQYFLVGKGGKYKNAGSIPVLRAQRYYAGLPAGAVVTSGQPETDFLNDAYPPDSETPIWGATSPSRSEYIQWMENARTLGWGSISVDDSQVNNWLGPWDASVTYNEFDTVTVEVTDEFDVTTTKNFMCQRDGFTSSTPPNEDSSNWQEMTELREILVEDSRISRWLGNYFLRTARYVLAA